MFEYFLIGIQIIFRVNRIPDNYLVAKGSQWFSITDKFARFILEKTDYIYKQFHNTFAPDEYFIAMIAINSEFRSNLYRKDCDGDMHANMRYIDWIRGNPYVFRETDWDLLINSGLCFARKFDSNVDNNIIEKISGWVKNDQ